MSLRLDLQAVAPAGMKAYGGVHLYIAACGLPKCLVDLVFLRASQINGCTFCIAMHTRDLIAEGVSAEKLLLLSGWQEAEGWFSARERAALTWTDALTLIAETHAPDSAYDSVREQFSDKEIADLTMAIGLINSYNRLGVGMRRGPGDPPSASGS